MAESIATSDSEVALHRAAQAGRPSAGGSPPAAAGTAPSGECRGGNVAGCGERHVGPRGEDIAARSAVAQAVPGAVDVAASRQRLPVLHDPVPEIKQRLGAGAVGFKLVEPICGCII